MRSLHAFFVLFAVVAVAGCHHAGVGTPDLSGPAEASGPDLSSLPTSGDMAYPIVFNPDLGTGCTPAKCTTGQCGPVADGCGGLLQCGSCSANQSCGGGGTPSVCGTPCVAATCSSLGVNCGSQSDGCGGTLDCGTCTAPATCGGSGTPSVCGNESICTPTTCAALGYSCGKAGDGCGNELDCGTCTSPEICGGGGVHSQCGKPPCVPTTCAAVGSATCGPIGDGCGGTIQCGGCAEPTICGGQAPGQCGVPSSCTGLCLQQQTCSNPAVTTTLSGTVYAPNAVDPLPNVLVYVPNAPVAAFTPGVACETCADGVSGSPLVSAATDTTGHFTISNMPVGTNIPLVIQTGRWRRQVTISTVTACQDNAADPSLTRLPRNKGEGDIPLMAFVTGRVDALECVMLKIGIDQAEFTSSNENGRVHLYKGDGTTAIFTRGLGGAVAPDVPPDGGVASPTEDDLTNTTAQLDKYDMVLFPCKGDEYDRPTSPINQQDNLISYANAGGRVFATHFSYTWLYNDAPFSMTAAWDKNQCDPSVPSSQCFPNDQTGYIDTTFPKGLELAQWLQFINASPTYAQIELQSIKLDVDSVVVPSQRWMTIHDSALVHQDPPMHMTFNTPVGAPSAQQCGRVLFDDFHVETVSSDATYNAVFPNECLGGPMTAQEKLLEFMIFDLGSCVTPDMPVCNKTTCAAQNIGCGPAGDGCGGTLNCGTCTAPQTCGGGGTPSQCGAPSCTPITCASQGIQCGPASDGCGGALSCGTCPPGETCGGGGSPGVCGNQPCTPIDCAAQHLNCGPAGDGCGGTIASCGTCVSPQTCGGAGTPGQCGQLCTPQTCQQLGFNCGPVGDGCGGQINCGTCSAPSTCGGGGQANTCGGGVID